MREAGIGEFSPEETVAADNRTVTDHAVEPASVKGGMDRTMTLFWPVMGLGPTLTVRVVLILTKNVGRFFPGTTWRVLLCSVFYYYGSSAGRWLPALLPRSTYCSMKWHCTVAFR